MKGDVLTSSGKGAKEGQPLDFPDSNPPKLRIRVTDVNRREHLAGVVGSLYTFIVLRIVTSFCRRVRKVVSAAPLTTLPSKTYARSLAVRGSRKVARQVMRRTRPMYRSTSKEQKI